MQPLTAPPRDHLTDAQVRALITGPRLDKWAGAELLDLNLRVIEDISDDLASCTVTRNMDATIHGACRVSLSRQIDWGTQLVRLYQTLSDGIITARFNVGVFSLTTPQHPYGPIPATYDSQGYDRLYWLNRQVGDSRSVATGAKVLAAVRQAFTDAGLTGVSIDPAADDKTLPKAMTWPLLPQDAQPATWLRVVNDLLPTVSYRGVWADQDGEYRSQLDVTPLARETEWTFDEGPTTTIQTEDRTLVEENWQTPNRWIFVQSNRPIGSTPTDGAGLYTVDRSAGDPRGVWPIQVSFDVTDQASLEALGDARVDADTHAVRTWKVTTGPFPLAGHWDVASLTVDGETHKVVCTDWQQDLVGGTVDWTWQEVS